MGIGFAIAQALADEGAAIIIADIDADVGDKAARSLRNTGTRAMTVTCDVADPGSAQSAVAAACETFGGINILINNAGLHLSGYVEPVSALALDDWLRLLDVNVLGVVICANACRASMRARRRRDCQHLIHGELQG